MILITTLALIGFVIYDFSEITARKQAEEHAEKARIALEEANRRKEELRLIENEYNSHLDTFISAYGTCTTDILLGDDLRMIEDHLFIFENAQTLVLRGEPIPFVKILNYALNDDSKQITQNHTGYESVTTTSTGSMLGRAVVGGALLGGVGALAGATTAKKETTTTPTISSSTSFTVHEYILYINIDDLRNPTREINLGSDTNKALNVANIFNVIIQRNKR